MTNSGQETVYLDSCRDYDPVSLKDFFDKAIPPALNTSLPGARVLVKPNLLSHHKGGLACTDPRFIAALAQWLLDHRAVVSVGDSPAFGRAEGVLRGLGVHDELKKYGVRLKNFATSTPRRLACGIEITIAAEALDCDLFVNAPKLKAHSQMYMTMAVKNIFGIVLGMRKALLHMRHGDEMRFSRMLIDLLDLLPHHCSVIDGVTAMHRQGPVHGEPLPVGCLGCAANPVALDTALLHALALPPQKSPLWREAARRGNPATDLENLSFALLPPQVFAGIRFTAPDQLAPIRFSSLRFVAGSFKRCAMHVGMR